MEFIKKIDFFKGNLAKKVVIINIVVLAVLFIINMFFIYVPLNYKFLFRFLILWSVINGSILIFYSIQYNKKKLRIGVILTVLLIVVLGNVTTYKMFNYKRYRNLAGEIKTHEFTEDIEAVDLSKLPINNGNLAKNLADKKLGDIPSLGSQVTIGGFTIQKVKDELFYVAPLEHAGFFKWFSNRNGTPGYVMVNATKQNDVRLVTEVDGKKLNIKYLDSAYIFSNLKRHAYLNKATKGLMDYSFELDDNLKPYWAISMYDLSVGLSGNKVVGTLLIDAQTGESKTYTVEETPAWVDRIQPEAIVKTNLTNWGELVHGVFNFSNKDKLALTDGIKVIYNGDDCYYYTGVTSVGADESLVGFFLTNSKTGITNLYKVSGAIETAAIKSAAGKVQQFGYTATFPILTNIHSQPTYFTTLLDNKGLIKSYAFINVKNYNIVGVGETVNEAYNDYLDDISKDTTIEVEDEGEAIYFNGVVDRIGHVTIKNAQYSVIKLKDNNKTFIIPIELDNKLSLTKEGDSVEIEYNDGSKETTAVKKFKNVTLE